MEQRRNARAGELGDPRENPPTSRIVRHDSHMRKSRPGIEPGLLWWEASSLTGRPPWPLPSRVVVSIFVFGVIQYDIVMQEVSGVCCGDVVTEVDVSQNQISNQYASGKSLNIPSPQSLMFLPFLEQQLRAFRSCRPRDPPPSRRRRCPRVGLCDASGSWARVTERLVSIDSKLVPADMSHFPTQQRRLHDVCRAARHTEFTTLRNEIVWQAFPTMANTQLITPVYLELFSEFVAERRGCVKGDTATRIKSSIAAKRKALNWRAVFSSCCVYLWDFQQRPYYFIGAKLTSVTGTFAVGHGVWDIESVCGKYPVLKFRVNPLLIPPHSVPTWATAQLAHMSATVAGGGGVAPCDGGDKSSPRHTPPQAAAQHHQHHQHLQQQQHHHPDPDAPLNLSKPKMSPGGGGGVPHQLPHHQHQQGLPLGLHGLEQPVAATTPKLLPPNLMVPHAFLPYTGLPPHLGPLPSPAGKLGITTSQGMPQTKEGLMSPDKHPHFPLHMYGLPTPHLPSPKSHREEQPLGSSKDESDFMAACQSSYRVCCYNSNVFVEPVDRRGSYIATSGYWTTKCDHITG
ncbi:hypothetical protein PR048_019481 [Dryococelus australis]|uniref:Uncharacterized protein n=1 Tax=Dryococelus australis TaxID=614101 RepID=A0ABQ9H3L0_9NEOP|nr:hypothetical protein PR048_019481 [Dryococelus australis]